MQRSDRGRGSGALTVIGLGPGDAQLLSPQALDALVRAETIVGYGTYIDLIDPDLLTGKEVIITGMKKEMDRVAAAVDRAQDGSNVVVVSSGDAGIYGMAGLVLETLEARNLLEDIPLRILPGIPALAAGAALLGAPLTHDFAVISLSDLMTPWETIEQRVTHAAAADFAIVLYNPKSRRRDWQLPRALELIAEHRSPETPVGLVRKAFRPGQDVTSCALSEFDPASVDMLSIVFIGNSNTRLSAGHMITPRGYLAKYGRP
ncbi:precorrin-3B C(17)-methyltransferase [Desulfovibrio ferrophilus]|uniref:Cobalt-precorrin-3B C(17)-methyltransferase n=1 Tax=Desulfovibrio ferrophilus TaxID=241368 RepID=A0A2Z6B2K9_9BACT|nr:precorrin-3B C(17)-methyltransferase [Desulfovibrio ferrophilus]BBD09693.1 cobalt-precorrin-3B C(17)-methyltransferase [Desulfovibrio ferrophilus]